MAVKVGSSQRRGQRIDSYHISTMQAYIDSYCQCNNAAKEQSEHVIGVHARDILLNTLQPVFKRQTQMHPTLSKRPEPKYRAAYETDLHENQQWKLDNSVELLFWVIEQISVRKNNNRSQL